MNTILFNKFNRLASCMVVATVGLTGCGGIELESKLLDKVGVGGLIGDGKHKEQPLETRSALVVPPSVEQLPVPGQTNTAAAPLDPSFPQNPETVEAKQKKIADAKRKAECGASEKKYGSRQGGPLSDHEAPDAKSKAECSSALKDFLGNPL